VLVADGAADMGAARADRDEVAEAVDRLGVDLRIAAADEDRGLVRFADVVRGEPDHGGHVRVLRNVLRAPDGLPHDGEPPEDRADGEPAWRDPDGGGGDCAGAIGLEGHESTEGASPTPDRTSSTTLPRW